MNTLKSSFYLATGAALLLALAACSSAGPGTETETGASAGSMPSMTMDTSSNATSAIPDPAPPPSAAAAATIIISGFAYRGPESVAAGTMVTVTNRDSVAHTVTSDTGSLFDAVVQPGVSATFKAPTASGTYTYHCTYHNHMHGRLVIK